MTYGQGSVYRDHRRSAWYFRWMHDGQRMTTRVGSFKDYPTESKALKAGLAMKPEIASTDTIGHLVLRYRNERMPERYSTKRAYDVWISNYILPKWGAHPVSAIKANEIEPWLKGMNLSPKSRQHIRGLIGNLLEFAMYREIIPHAENPMKLVHLEGVSKRVRPKRILEMPEFLALCRFLPRPLDLAARVAVCTGLRFSEDIALQWRDIDWLEKRMLIRRGMVVQREGEVKTEYSNKPMPLDDWLLDDLKLWHSQTLFKAETDWIWASPASLGKLPYSYTHFSEVLAEASTLAGIPKVTTHAFRHTFRSWLSSTGAAITVQQKLMRHSDVRTTMNVYGDALPDDLRSAHSTVVKKMIGCEMDAKLAN